MRTRLSSLYQDVLKTILLLVVASAGGATDLAKAVTLSKEFAKFGNDKDLLKVANFVNFSLLDVQHCYNTKGLLVKCAEAGNVGAQYVLAQVILLGFSQHLNGDFSLYPDKDPLRDFLCYFIPGQAVTAGSNRKRFTHFELVSLFLSRSSILDHVSLMPYVKKYMKLVGNWNIGSVIKFYKYFLDMNNVIRVIVHAGGKRRMQYSPRLHNDRVEPEMRRGSYVMSDLANSVHHYSRNIKQPSESEWEELKRECQYIEKKKLCSECYLEPLEGEHKILDTGKRWFYYLAFSGLVTRDITLALGYVESDIQTKCFLCAKKYYTLQQMAASAFDRTFLTGDIASGPDPALSSRRVGFESYQGQM